MKPKILLVFLMRFEEATRMLQGIVQHERSHRQWSTFLDDEARTERDPGFLRGEKWQGVISRHTTPALVKNCAQLGIPLVDLNDTPPFPGVPKIRPYNTAIGHLGAEHCLLRFFQRGLVLRAPRRLRGGPAAHRSHLRRAGSQISG